MAEVPVDEFHNVYCIFYNGNQVTFGLCDKYSRTLDRGVKKSKGHRGQTYFSFNWGMEGQAV